MRRRTEEAAKDAVREEAVKIGARLTRHARRLILQMAGSRCRGTCSG
jgi:predicted translin family RNA/ssDNA-binding protein